MGEFTLQARDPNGRLVKVRVKAASESEAQAKLTKRGFVTLSIGTTEATEAKTYSIYWPSVENAEVQPLSMLGYAAPPDI